MIATRRNDSTLGVANRQTWTVQHVGTDGTLTVVEAASARRHQRSVTLPPSYVAEHVHLAYATTGYGVQGVTTTTAHTLVSESLDAAGRVRRHDPRPQRQRAAHCRRQPRRGARAVHRRAGARPRRPRPPGRHHRRTSRRRRPRRRRPGQAGQRRTVAPCAAHRAGGARGRAMGTRRPLSSADQAQSHAHEEAQASSALMQASGAASTAVRNEVLEPLLAQATADGQIYLDADAREHEAWTATQSASRLGKRGAERRLAATRAGTGDAKAAVLDRWGSVPDPGRWGIKTRDSLEPWAERVAMERADAEPEGHRGPAASSVSRGGAPADPIASSARSRGTDGRRLRSARRCLPPRDQRPQQRCGPRPTLADSTPTSSAPTSPASNPSPSDEPCSSSRRAGLRPSRSRSSKPLSPAATGRPDDGTPDRPTRSRARPRHVGPGPYISNKWAATPRGYILPSALTLMGATTTAQYEAKAVVIAVSCLKILSCIWTSWPE